MAVFYKGDVSQQIKKVENKSVNLIYINPPFGTTQNFWDEKIDWTALFIEFYRVLRDDGMIVIHCSVPFNYTLIRSAPHPPSYSWYWKKENTTNYLNSNKQPLRQVEEILVWKNKKLTYYKQQIGNEMITYTIGRSIYYNKNKCITITTNGKTRSDFIDMKRDIDGYSTRPVELVKLMIDSYSKEGDVILDCFCYNGLSHTQCKNRRWIGIDKYFIPKYLI